VHIPLFSTGVLPSLTRLQQLHAATASVPLAQRVYSYTRALLCGTEGLLSLCALVLLAAAAIGVSMGLGRFGDCVLRCCHRISSRFSLRSLSPGDYFLGIQFLSNPTQKVVSSRMHPSRSCSRIPFASAVSRTSPPAFFLGFALVLLAGVPAPLLSCHFDNLFTRFTVRVHQSQHAGDQIKLHGALPQFVAAALQRNADKVSQGPFCNLDPATCPGDVPPLFDYYDGINPCLCVDSMTMADRDLAFGLLWIALGLGCLLMLNCIVTPCLHAISSESVRKIVKVHIKIVFHIINRPNTRETHSIISCCLPPIDLIHQVWFPATTGSFLATIIAVAAWKLYISMTNFARRRADDISNNGQRGGSGSGSSDQLDVLPTTLSRAFVAMVAVLSTSAVPVVLALCIYARTRYIAQQQVFPGSADAPAPSH